MQCTAANYVSSTQGASTPKPMNSMSLNVVRWTFDLWMSSSFESTLVPWHCTGSTPTITVRSRGPRVDYAPINIHAHHHRPTSTVSLCSHLKFKEFLIDSWRAKNINLELTKKVYCEIIFFANKLSCKNRLLVRGLFTWTRTISSSPIMVRMYWRTRYGASAIHNCV